MSPSRIEYVTSECPKGHRVRGDIGWLDREVRCPHCQTKFKFQRPDGTAVEVVAPDGSKMAPPKSVSDTSVMKILGDFANAASDATKTDGTTRHCAECGATYPGYFDTCYNCNVPLGPIVGGPADASESESTEKVDFRPMNPFPFDNVVVRKVMRPRKEIVFLEVDDSLSELLKTIRQSGRTRYVACDRSLDKVAGLVHIEDIVLADDENFDIHRIIRPIEQIIETTPVSDVLFRLQKAGEPIALVVDEFDTVIGMVTVKDVMLKLLKK